MCLEAIRQSAHEASLSNDLALRDLFESSEASGTSSEKIAYIADYFEGQEPRRSIRVQAVPTGGERKLIVL